MAAPRTEEQPLTYQGLRDLIQTYLVNSQYEEISQLITGQNIEMLQRCAPSMIGAEDQVNTVSLAEQYARCTTVVGDIGKAGDVDAVLLIFTSSNALAVQVCQQANTTNDAQGLVDYITAESLAKNLPECS